MVALRFTESNGDRHAALCLTVCVHAVGAGVLPDAFAWNGADDLLESDFHPLKKRPLHFAAERLRIEWIETLIEKGASPTGIDASGATPLHGLLALSNRVPAVAGSPTLFDCVRSLANAGSLESRDAGGRDAEDAGAVDNPDLPCSVLLI